ncbi:MAG: type II toxin-antitoxin system HicA family toxin [Deltaproteobacteria bacterium]|nr:type II toxin-antitoxin system HicA family toxin [Deltaproteobacteria bacterium]
MTGRELIRLLEKDGWVLDRIKGSHHIMIKENKTLSVPVHGSKDLGKGILNKLSKKGGLKNENNLLSC